MVPVAGVQKTVFQGIGRVCISPMAHAGALLCSAERRGTSLRSIFSRCSNSLVMEAIFTRPAWSIEFEKTLSMCLLSRYAGNARGSSSFWARLSGKRQSLCYAPGRLLILPAGLTDVHGQQALAPGYHLVRGRHNPLLAGLAPSTPLLHKRQKDFPPLCLCPLSLRGRFLLTV